MSHNIEIRPEEISACHTLGRPSKDGKHTVIVRFASRKSKTVTMKKGKRLKGSGIYLNDHLTSKNSELAKSARDLKRDSNGKIIRTWTWDCKVFVKDNMGNVKMINDDSDLSDFR